MLVITKNGRVTSRRHACFAVQLVRRLFCSLGEDGVDGRWSKTYSGYDPGVWHVAINTIGWLFDDPHGGGQNQDAEYPAPGKVQINAAIIEPPLWAYDRGGFFCGDPVDPDGVFSYSVSKDGSQLTLTADAPVCTQDLIGGTWEREK